MTMMAITGKGLKPLAGANLFLGVGQRYFFGASSDPRMVVVDRISDEWVEYYNYPYRVSQRDSIEIFRDLAAIGTETWLQSGYAKYQPKLADSLRKVMAGEAGDIVSPVDYQTVIVKIKCRNKEIRDPWSDFETRIEMHSISAQDNDGLLELYMERNHVASIRDRINEMATDEYEIVGVQEDRDTKG